MANIPTWTAEQIARLRELYPNHTNAEIAQYVGHTHQAVRYKAKQLRLVKDKAWLYGKCSGTMFKKGHIPVNKAPVGHERKGKDGYWLVKTAEPNVFRMKNRVIWEQHHGPIPDNTHIVFIDGNPDNCNIENLRAESLEEKFHRTCSIHTTLPPDIRYMLQLKGALKRQINKIENKNGKKRNRKTEIDEGPPMGL